MLIGTLDVKESEELAEGLAAAGVPCVVLNAKNDAEEAAIIAEAGTYGAVTVSTQMAGRGVDIRLGGSDQADRDRVAELGGLYVIGSGQHESRRVDDQLRGRAGRQGDPGGSVFFVSLEDDLVVRNAGDEIPAVADDDRRRPGHDEQVDWAVGARPAGRRGRQLRDPPQHLALQRGHRAAAQGAGRAPRAGAHHRRGRRHAARALPREVPRRSTRTCSSRVGPVDRAVPHRPAVGRAPGRCSSEVREGVHLRALARVDPLDEFHRAAVPAFNELIPEIERRTIETFEQIQTRRRTGSPSRPSSSGPSATWTYLVHDNPFGSEMDRLVSLVGKGLRGQKG